MPVKDPVKEPVKLLAETEVLISKPKFGEMLAETDPLEI
jgi:hypothetical protein